MKQLKQASNVFCILPHAQKFEIKICREDRRWEVIEMYTEEAVTSVISVTVERSARRVCCEGRKVEREGSVTV